MRKWVVYTVGENRMRERPEKILARSAPEAIRHYRLLFNVRSEVNAIPFYSGPEKSSK